MNYNSANLTKYKNTNFLIYNKLDDKSLIILSSVSKNMFHLSIDENYFKYRILSYYGSDVVINKPDDIIRILYVDVIKNNNKFYSRLDLILCINKIYSWYPNIRHLNMIIMNNTLNVLKYIINKFSIDIKQTDDELIDSALFSGNIDIAIWLSEIYKLIPTQEGVDECASNSKLISLIWIYEKYKLLPNISSVDNIDIIKWLIKINKFIIDEYFLDNISDNCDICYWLINNYYLQPTSDMLDKAISKGNNIFSTYLIENFNLIPTSCAVYYAYDNNNVDTLRMLYKQYDFKIDNSYPFQSYDNIEAFKFVYEQSDIKISKNRINTVLEGNRFKILKYIYEISKILPDDRSINFTVGHISPFISHENVLDLTKWLISINRSLGFDQNTINNIAHSGNLILCKFMCSNYNIIPDKKYIKWSLDHENYPMFHWLSKIYNIINN